MADATDRLLTGFVDFLFYDLIQWSVADIMDLNLAGFVDLSGLTTEDHVTLTIIEHYLDFKVRASPHMTCNTLGYKWMNHITYDKEYIFWIIDDFVWVN